MKMSLSKNSTNQEIATALEFIAGVLDLQGANKFRVRAYDNAATVISQLDTSLKQMVNQKKDLTKIQGIGTTLAEKFEELFKTGSIKAFEEYTKEIPVGTYSLSQLHGLGVKKAYKIASAFNLENESVALNKTKQLALNNKIRNLDGFGEKSETDLITMIDNFTQKKRMPYNKARLIADNFIEQLKESDSILKAVALGSLRRKSNTIGDIDIGIITDNIGLVKSHVKSMKNVKRVSVSGSQLLRVFLNIDVQIDIKVSNQEEWGAFLQHFTGSKEHNIKLREFALKQGKSLSEHGIKKTASGEMTYYHTEEAFYDALRLNWIPPQDRIGRDEIESALIKQKSAL